MSDLENALRRINILIDRAVHEGTPIEEARTSAHLAVKMIRDNKLAVGRLIQPHGPAYPAPPPPWPAPPRPARRAPYGFISIISQYEGRCRKCSNLYRAGERLAWVKTQGSTHWECRDYWRGSA